MDTNYLVGLFSNSDQGNGGECSSADYVHTIQATPSLNRYIHVHITVLHVAIAWGTV